MEEWKEIPGLLSRYGKYYASADGRVKNEKGLILLVRPHYKGYKMVRVVCNGKERNFQVHRAVALAWLPNPDNKPQVNHKNGIKADNRLDNLEWCTNAENQRHAYDTGLKVGIKTGKPFYIRVGCLSREQVRDIRNTVIKINGRGGISRLDLCKKYGVSLHVIKDVRARRSYVDYE